MIGIALVIVLGFMAMQMSNAAKASKAAEALDKNNQHTVARGDIGSSVIETGTIDAVKMVEVRSRVSGRVKKLYIDEGDYVSAGQLIAEVDPRETELQVRQNQAQLRGARASVARSEVEIQQQRTTSLANLRQAEARLEQLKAELNIQPMLTSASIRQAKAALDTAITELDRLTTTAHPLARTAAEAAVREAEANLQNAKADYQRQAELLKDGYVSQKVVENAELQVKLAETRYKTASEELQRLSTSQKLELARAEDDRRRAQASYDTAIANRIQNETKRKEYESAVQDIEKARAALRGIEALVQSKISSQATVDQLATQLEDAQRNLGETEIRAPISGIITSRLIQEGELVSGLTSFSSGTPVVKLEDRTTLRVMLNINEVDTAKLKVGMEAIITVDALPGKTFKGVVKRIAPSSTTANTSTTTNQVVNTETVVKFAVEIWLTTTDPALRSGMSAKCDLVVNSKKNVLLVPIDYISKEKDGVFVELAPAKKGDKPEKKKVKTGIESGAFVEIVEGIKEGDVLQRPKFTGPARKGMMGPG